MAALNVWGDPLNVWEDKPPRNKQHQVAGVGSTVVKHKGCRASLTLLNVWEDKPQEISDIKLWELEAWL